MKKFALFVNNGDEYMLVRWANEDEVKKVTSVFTPFANVMIHVAEFRDSYFEIKANPHLHLIPTGIHPTLYYSKFVHVKQEIVPVKHYDLPKKKVWACSQYPRE